MWKEERKEAVKLRELIDISVKQTISAADKPVGVLLSGGLDSSAVAAFAGYKTTFTGFYNEPGFDERIYARRAAIGPLQEVMITEADFIEYLPDMLKKVYPFDVGPGIFGQWMVAMAANSVGINTLLSGEGGDELFGGYARLMKVAGVPMPAGYENYKPVKEYPDNLEDALKYDWELLPLLMEADTQICDAWNIEVRAPLLHPDIVDYAMNLPAEKRVGKVVLKEAMKDILHPDIINRKDKKGFPTPFVLWAQRDPVKTFVLDHIGYIPDINKPYDRAWWYDLCKAVIG